MVRLGIRVAAGVVGVALVAGGCGAVDGGAGAGEQQPSGPDSRPVKAGGTLRVALDAEPDKLDPTLSRTLVGREIFQSICDKLYDVNEKLEIVPQLAAGMPEVSADGKTVTIKLRTGLKFADGTSFDAAAVKISLDRHRTLAGSARKSELTAVTEVRVVDPATVAIHLSTPFSPLTAQFTDRAGMVMSPAALASGKDFATEPVCIGAY